MKTKSHKTKVIGLLTTYLLLFSAFSSEKSEAQPNHDSIEIGDSLKEKAFDILVNKCNTCHRKQNPFMIFKMKNMENRAKKIYNMVFVTKRMPKGDEIKLSPEEYETLKSWLSTQNTY